MEENKEVEGAEGERLYWRSGERSLPEGSKETRHPGEEGKEDVPAHLNGAVRTLDGEMAGDEFAGDAINYQILLGKIDKLLEKLKLDA